MRRLALLAQSLPAKLRATGSGEAEIAVVVAHGLCGALAQTWALANGLISVQIDAAGLMVTLEQLAENTRWRSGIDCRFEYDQPARIDDNHVACRRVEPPRRAGDARKWFDGVFAILESQARDSRDAAQETRKS